MAFSADFDDDELGAVGGRDDQSKTNITMDDYEMEDEAEALDAKKLHRKKSPSKLRPRCQYADDCYRKNPHHRKSYCHPGDEDWNGAGKQRPKPRCPFGEFCTRRNLRHLEYFHQPSTSNESEQTRSRGVGDDVTCSKGKDQSDGSGARQITDADFNAVRPKVRTTVPPTKPPRPSTTQLRRALSTLNREASDARPTPNKKIGFECGCCFLEDIPLAESVACGSGHLFCQDCLKNYVNSILFGVGKTTLFCLGADCESLFSTMRLASFIDRKTLDSLEERQQREMLATAFGEMKDERLHRCPACSFTCLVPASAQHFVCFQCKAERCLFCDVDWKKHMDYGYVCDDVEGDDESKIRRKTEEAMTQAFVRNCHRCATPLLKESGCNKMTCRCGASLCYVCKQPVNGYDHFCQHTSGPGQATCRLPGCGKCSLVDDPVDAPRIEAERVKGEAERGRLGVKDRKKIGGDVATA